MAEEKDGYEEIFDEAGDTNNADEATRKDNGEVTEKVEADSKEEQPKPTLITKEDVEKFGLSKGLIGKPITEMFSEYQNIRKFETQNAQKIAALTQEIGKFSEALTKKEVAQVVKEVEEELPDLSKFIDDTGYITDVKGYNAAVAKRDELRDAKLRKEFKKMLDEKEKETEAKNAQTLKTVESVQMERNLSKLYDEVTDGLKSLYSEGEITPQLIDEAIKGYNDYLSEEDEESQANYARLYAGKPEKMAKAILMYHRANSYTKPTDDSEAKKAAKQAHEKTLEKLKRTEKKFTDSASSPRGQVTEKDVYSDLLDEVAEEVRS